MEAELRYESSERRLGELRSVDGSVDLERVSGCVTCWSISSAT